MKIAGVLGRGHNDLNCGLAQHSDLPLIAFLSCWYLRPFLVLREFEAEEAAVSAFASAFTGTET